MNFDIDSRLGDIELEEVDINFTEEELNALPSFCDSWEIAKPVLEAIHGAIRSIVLKFIIRQAMNIGDKIAERKQCG